MSITWRVSADKLQSLFVESFLDHAESKLTGFSFQKTKLAPIQGKAVIDWLRIVLICSTVEENE